MNEMKYLCSRILESLEQLSFLEDLKMRHIKKFNMGISSFHNFHRLKGFNLSQIFGAKLPNYLCHGKNSI